MEELLKKQDEFLGMDSVRSALGITISYWKSMEAIIAWKNNI
ncbi:antibiotic biosynthesis monooxygenase [Tenacibaculum sp. SG-28]